MNLLNKTLLAISLTAACVSTAAAHENPYAHQGEKTAKKYREYKHTNGGHWQSAQLESHQCKGHKHRQHKHYKHQHYKHKPHKYGYEHYRHHAYRGKLRRQAYQEPSHCYTVEYRHGKRVIIELPQWQCY